MAFCPNCGTGAQATAAFCMACGGSIQPRTHTAATHLNSEPVEGHSSPIGAVTEAQKTPSSGSEAEKRQEERARRFHAALPVILQTLLGAFVVLLILGLAIADPAKKAFDNALEDTRDQATKIYKIEELAVRDAALLEFMGSASSGGSGDGDERLDRLTQNIRAYVAVAEKADFKSCPSGLVDTYKRHVALWDDVADAVSKHPHIPTEDEKLVIRMAQQLTGNFDIGAAQEQGVEVWARRVQAAEKDAEKGSQDFLAASNSAVDAVGKD